MNLKEGLREYRKMHDRGQNYYCVHTLDDGTIYLHADSMLVNDSGSLIFMRRRQDDKSYPVLVLSSTQFTTAYPADPKTRKPVAVEEWFNDLDVSSRNPMEV